MSGRERVAETALWLALLFLATMLGTVASFLCLLKAATIPCTGPWPVKR